MRKILLMAAVLGLGLTVSASDANACHKKNAAPCAQPCPPPPPPCPPPAPPCPPPAPPCPPPAKKCCFKMPKMKMPKMGCHKKAPAPCPQPVVMQHAYYAAPTPAPQSYVTPAPQAYGAPQASGQY